jgi:hypothetical protein
MPAAPTDDDSTAIDDDSSASPDDDTTPAGDATTGDDSTGSDDTTSNDDSTLSDDDSGLPELAEGVGEFCDRDVKCLAELVCDPNLDDPSAGTCRQACENNELCPAGWVCVERETGTNLCEQAAGDDDIIPDDDTLPDDDTAPDDDTNPPDEAGLGEPCSRDIPCETSLICVEDSQGSENGTCRQDCTSDHDSCPSGKWCVEQVSGSWVCLVDDRADHGEACNHDLACKPGLICYTSSSDPQADGICYEDCTQSDTCSRPGYLCQQQVSGKKICEPGYQEDIYSGTYDVNLSLVTAPGCDEPRQKHDYWSINYDQGTNTLGLMEGSGRMWTGPLINQVTNKLTTTTNPCLEMTISFNVTSVTGQISNKQLSCLCETGMFTAVKM